MAMDPEVEQRFGKVVQAQLMMCDQHERLCELTAVLAEQVKTLSTANRDLAEQVVELMDWKTKTEYEAQQKKS